MCNIDHVPKTHQQEDEQEVVEVGARPAQRVGHDAHALMKCQLLAEPAERRQRGTAKFVWNQLFDSKRMRKTCSNEEEQRKAGKKKAMGNDEI